MCNCLFLIFLLRKHIDYKSINKSSHQNSEHSVIKKYVFFSYLNSEIYISDSLKNQEPIVPIYSSSDKECISDVSNLQKLLLHCISWISCRYSGCLAKYLRCFSKASYAFTGYIRL